MEDWNRELPLLLFLSSSEIHIQLPERVEGSFPQERGRVWILKIILQPVTGNVITSDVDVLTYIVISMTEKYVPYRKLVGTTECVTLKPRSRTNRGCYNRVNPWLIINFSSSTCHPTIWNKTSRRRIYKSFKDVLCKNSVSTYQRTFYKTFPSTNCVHPRRNACLYIKKSFLFAKRLTTFKIDPTIDSS